MKNRGYRYIIKNTDVGYLFLCINASWINQMLKDRGIRLRDFRRLSWEDIAMVQTDERRKLLFSTLKPKSFWEMCDTLSLSYAEYDKSLTDNMGNNILTPILTQEDLYEILVDRGFQQEDALRVMEVVRRGRCVNLKLSQEEFMQLYDVPEDIYEIIKNCKYIPSREKVILSLLDSIERAIYAETIRLIKSEKRSLRIKNPYNET